MLPGSRSSKSLSISSCEGLQEPKVRGGDGMHGADGPRRRVHPRASPGDARVAPGSPRADATPLEQQHAFPACASRHAIDVPVTPPPTTMTSGDRPPARAASFIVPSSAGRLARCRRERCIARSSAGQGCGLASGRSRAAARYTPAQVQPADFRQDPARPDRLCAIFLVDCTPGGYPSCFASRMRGACRSTSRARARSWGRSTAP